MTARRVWTVALAFVLSGAPALGQVTIFFDNGGAESGITAPGTTEFSFMGSDWEGGIVRTERVPRLYASGSFSYEVPDGPARVSFDPLIESATFFYVHDSGFAPGAATAFAMDGQEIARADSSEATRFGDPANFVTLQGSAAIARIEFSAGVIDNFTFAVAAEPTATAPPTATATAPPTASDTPTEVSTPTRTLPPGPQPCVGDCDGDGAVTVSELVRGVNIALGTTPLESCAAFDSDQDGDVSINELIAAVNAALLGCIQPPGSA